jgi:hypothetical protein
MLFSAVILYLKVGGGDITQLRQTTQQITVQLNQFSILTVISVTEREIQTDRADALLSREGVYQPAWLLCCAAAVF